MKVYIAAPYTIGDVGQNVRLAVFALHRLMDLGYHPFCPHLFHFAHLFQYRAYEDWTALDLEWLRLSNAVLQLPGESKGVEEEVKLARELGIPVFQSIKTLHDALRS